MQPFSEKCLAIESLLAFVWFHLDFVPGAMEVRRYGQSEGVQPARAAKPYNVDCNGRCDTCRAYHETLGKKPACPPDERWATEYRTLRRRYRIADVEDSLYSMADFQPLQAQAVWAVHVEPWPDPKTEPIGEEARARRQIRADQGIVWMAHDIKGDVIAYGEKPDPKANQIRQLYSQGFSQRRIAKEVGCSLRDVNRIVTAEVSAMGG
jgi:hypothetical protein